MCGFQKKRRDQRRCLREPREKNRRKKKAKQIVGGFLQPRHGEDVGKKKPKGTEPKMIGDHAEKKSRPTHWESKGLRGWVGKT